ncbi:alpha/beta fold hydrolase [Edaphobacter aggregans]|uniref:alpha/beta fold hydrolase n=1 Tax=Edaphobacter aggregans TaxID=570835 RepID=UPI001FE1ED91|nr:alpha/beta hydrolase [Edaphobacter aggregans]
MWTEPAGDSSAHSVQFLTVENDVKLEVLDWGGTGRSMVLLAGLGNNAHVFDKFAPKLITGYHVYGITRRGFGASSAPAPVNDNYAADRLGDDVLAVIDALKINKPILIGHSIAGEELSSIGSRYPDKVAGLIYLDAGYTYAFYDPARGDFGIDLNSLRKQLESLNSGRPIREVKETLRELLQTSLPQFEKDLLKLQKSMQGTSDSTPLPPETPQMQLTRAMIGGMQKYTDIKCPVLAIYALPPDPGTAGSTDAADVRAEKLAQANAFEAGIPSAHVVRLAKADHDVFRSNEADVLREINAFVAKLPQ